MIANYLVYSNASNSIVELVTNKIRIGPVKKGVHFRSKRLKQKKAKPEQILGNLPKRLSLM